MKMNKFLVEAGIVGLTIFAMLLGIANLIFPIKLGIHSGGSVINCFCGFSLTSVLLPLCGVLGIVLFNGDYNAFFGRLGAVTGKLFVFACMMILGPLIVMPRTIALAHLLVQPIFPCMPLVWFAIFFVAVAFVLAYRPGKVLDLLGKVLSPLKIFSLLLIVVPGIWGAHQMTICPPCAWKFFICSVLDGYQTLDLIGAIFFGSIILRLLTRYASGSERVDMGRAVRVTALGGVFGGILIALVYLAMMYLGAFYNQGLCNAGEGEAFRQIVALISGCYGSFIIGFATLVVGMSTVVALTTVLGDYVQEITRKKVSYVPAALLVLAVCAFVATMGLGNILEYSKPLINFLYPLIIVTTVCNLLYKWRGFTWIKLPVLATALIEAWYIFW